MQLIQPYVQKSRSSTRPRKSARERRCPPAWIHSRVSGKSGARTAGESMIWILGKPERTVSGQGIRQRDGGRRPSVAARAGPPGRSGCPSLPGTPGAGRLAGGSLARRALAWRGGLEALLQPGDEVDDLRLLRLLHVLIRKLLPLELRLEERAELLLVLVLVLGRVERLGEVTDELLGHRELLRAHVLLLRVRKVDVLGFDELVLEAHELEDERVPLRTDGDEVFLLPHRELADAHHARAAERLAKERVCLLAAFLRNEVVRGVEIAGVDLVRLDEIGHLHRLAGGGAHAREVLRRDDDVLPLGVLVPLHDLVPGHDLLIARADPLVLDGSEVFLVQHAEAGPLGVAHRAHEGHRDVHEPEGQGASPDGCHAPWKGRGRALQHFSTWPPSPLATSRDLRLGP